MMTTLIHTSIPTIISKLKQKYWYSNISVDFLHPWKMIMDEYKMNVISPYLSNSKLIRMLRWAVTRLLESKKVYFVLQYEQSV